MSSDQQPTAPALLTTQQAADRLGFPRLQYLQLFVVVLGFDHDGLLIVVTGAVLLSLVH